MNFKIGNTSIWVASLNWWLFSAQVGAVDIVGRWDDRTCKVYEKPTIIYNYGPVYFEREKQ